MLPTTVMMPHRHRLMTLVDRLIDEELSRIFVDQPIDAVSLSPVVRAVVIEIVTRTLERIESEDL